MCRIAEIRKTIRMYIEILDAEAQMQCNPDMDGNLSDDIISLVVDNKNS